MNIPGSTARGKDGEGVPGWLPWLVLALAISASFALGMLAGKEAAHENASQNRFWVEQLPPEALAEPGKGTETREVDPGPAAAGAALPVPSAGAFVASRSGTKYYPPSCAAAKRIKETNRVWFATAAEAEAAGYEASTAC